MVLISTLSADYKAGYAAGQKDAQAEIKNLEKALRSAEMELSYAVSGEDNEA